MNGIVFLKEKIEMFCYRNHILELSLFGSVLREDFRLNNDVNVLVVFEEGHTPGSFELARTEDELSALLRGRKVNLRTPQDLSRYFREEVLTSAAVQYART